MKTYYANPDNSFPDQCAEFAERIQNLLIKDIFRRDFCLRYNKRQGAYISFDDYNDDEIILQSAEVKRNLTYPQQSQYLQSVLRSRPFFPVS